MSHATGLQYLKKGVLPHMWCSGCGIGTMLGCLLRAFEELGFAPQDTVVVTGIGCTGKLDDYLVTNALHTTHGRALAFATGIKACNPKLQVVVLMGDGDGVTIGYLTVPVRIDRHQVTCIRMRLETAEAGERLRPVPCPGSEHQLYADTSIIAVGQFAAVPTSILDRNRNGTVAVNPRTLAASVPGIFAGGDAVTGPSSIIEAIAQGRKAAMAMDRFLGGAGTITDALSGAEDVAAEVPEAAPRGTLRNRPAMCPAQDRAGSFDLAEAAFDEQTAGREAGRCLSCDLRAYQVEVNPAVCKGCGYCWEVCGLDVFRRSDQFNAGGYHPAQAVHPERCIGCLRCLYICPDFAITIRNPGED